MPLRRMGIRMSAMICDFCGNAPTFEYPCRDFLSKAFRAESTGPWMACADCAAAIDSESWNTLISRCVDAITLQPGVTAEELRMRMLAFHQEFQAHRTGSARPMGVSA